MLNTAPRPAGSCRRCKGPMVHHEDWHHMSPDERTIVRATGARPHEARGLCSRCYWWARTHGELIDYERKSYSPAELREEWDHYRAENPGQSKAQTIRELAPRLGKTENALAKAVQRAGIRTGPQRVFPHYTDQQRDQHGRFASQGVAA